MEEGGPARDPPAQGPPQDGGQGRAEPRAGIGRAVTRPGRTTCSPLRGSRRHLGICAVLPPEGHSQALAGARSPERLLLLWLRGRRLLLARRLPCGRLCPTHQHQLLFFPLRLTCWASRCSVSFSSAKCSRLHLLLSLRLFKVRALAVHDSLESCKPMVKCA